jgi:UDP-N-acetylmuramate dehydrogenase
MPLDPNIKGDLAAILGGDVRFDTPMAAHTYFKVGGPADALAMPRDTETLAALLRYCARARQPYRVIGGGTNLLVSDEGIRGVVIRLGKGFDAIRAAGADATVVTAMAGAKLAALCRYAVDRGLSGMNGVVGIPGSVGGALRMNAGTAHGSTADALASITVMRGNAEMERIDRDRLTAAYRRLSWPVTRSPGPGGPDLIVEGRFRLEPAEPQRLKAEARRLLEKRHRSQPVAQASAGCFFKNPAGNRTAGELIDLAGLKGKTFGRAQISEVHANYIVNLGGATAAEILALGDAVRAAVSDKFDIELETEVKIVGP